MTERTYTYAEMLANQAAAMREAAEKQCPWCARHIPFRHDSKVHMDPAGWECCRAIAILALTTDQLALDRHDAELRARVLDPEISKKFTYCAYCGHTESVDVDGEVIAAHIRTCEMHPLNIEIKELRAQTAALLEKAASLAHFDMLPDASHPSWREPRTFEVTIGGPTIEDNIRALIPTDYAAALEEYAQKRIRELK